MGRRSRLGRPVAGLALLATLGTTLPAEAVITPFGRRVNESVELAVQYLRDQGIDEGAMRWASGLGMLCMLEKRASADWNAPPVGYAGMDPEDQERMRRTAETEFLVSRGMGAAQGKKVRLRRCGQGGRGVDRSRPDQSMRGREGRG